MTKAGERLIAAAREARDALDKIEVGIPTSEIESAVRVTVGQTSEGGRAGQEQFGLLVVERLKKHFDTKDTSGQA